MNNQIYVNLNWAKFYLDSNYMLGSSIEREEFIIMLLIENQCKSGISNELYSYISDNYDISAFNNRYRELLDKFLSNYALNKTEKSEENL